MAPSVGLDEVREREIQGFHLPNVGRLPLADHELRRDAGLGVFREGEEGRPFAREQCCLRACEDQDLRFRAATSYARELAGQLPRPIPHRAQGDRRRLPAPRPGSMKSREVPLAQVRPEDRVHLPHARRHPQDAVAPGSLVHAAQDLHDRITRASQIQGVQSLGPLEGPGEELQDPTRPLVAVDAQRQEV